MADDLQQVNGSDAPSTVNPFGGNEEGTAGVPKIPKNARRAADGFYYEDYTGGSAPTDEQYNAFADRLHAGWNPWNAATGTPMDGGGGGTTSSSSTPTGNTSAAHWVNQGSYQPPDNSAQTALLQQMFAQQQADRAQNEARNKALYDQLYKRSTASLDIDPNDPIIKAQSDAFNADQTRGRRDYLNGLAEQKGPYANLRGEERMTSEKAGQASGNFHAQLMANELQQRRGEIADALNSMRGMLSADQQLTLQSQLGQLDNAIKQQQLSIQGYGAQTDRMVGMGGLANQLMGINNQNSQFYDQLGFNAEDRASYWDSLRRGLLG